MKTVRNPSPPANEPRRQSIHLPGHDFALAGVYFVTLVIQDRMCLFGDVVGVKMRLNAAGEMVQRLWQALPDRFPGVGVDAFIVMPNHIHGIISISQAVGAPLVGARKAAPQANGNGNIGRRAATRAAPTQDSGHSLDDVVEAYKLLTTANYRDGARARGWPLPSAELWQQGFYQHLVRNEGTLSKVRQYVHDNPAWWEFDRENPVLAPQPPEDG